MAMSMSPSLVVVPDGNALTVVSFPAHAGFLGDVGKCSVTIIVVKRRAQGLRWFVNASGGRLATVEIHQAALVIIDPTDAAAHGFEVILFFRLRGILTKSDSGRLSNVGVTDGYSGILRFRSLSSGSSDEGLCIASRQDCAARGSEMESSTRFRFFSFSDYRCAIAGKKLMRKQAHCTTAVTTNVVTAIAGDREDLSRVNITMPVTDAAPTIMVIAISKGEKCPLMMLAIPSTYSQMNTIKVNQNRKSGSPIQPAGRARRIPNAIPIQSGSVCTM